MGRRAVRKPDPSLDLARHLLTIEQLPSPWDAVHVFGREALLEVEIGSGKGMFLSRVAAAVPDHNFLGIEVAFKYARHAAGRLAKRGLANAAMVHGDGLRVFRETLPTAGVAAVHVYFPDPWWKTRHKKRRVVNETFLQDVERVLVPGGSLHLWTDVEEYFTTSVELIHAHTALAGPFDVVERPADDPLDYHTHFERRTRLAGEPVHRAEFRKSGK